MTIGDVLRTARAEIARSGWSQTIAIGGKVDMLTAIDRATLGDRVVLRMDVLEALDNLVPNGFAMLWHDEPGRTEAEVLALLDLARIRAGREEHQPEASP